MLEFFPSSKQVSVLWKPSFLQCGHALGLRLYAAVPLVSLPEFRPNLLVRFVTSAGELGACGEQGFVVCCQRRDCGHELLQHDFFCGSGGGKVVEVIFEVVNYGALWGSCLA